MKHKIFPLILILLFTPVFVLAQGTVYVKPSTASIRGGSGFGGPVVEEVAQNTPLTVVEDSRLRLLVRTPSGNEGYIVKSQTQAKPVGQSSGGLGGFVNDDRDISQMRTSSVNRGLTAENEALVDSGQISQEAVSDLEESQALTDSITETDVENFLRQGNLSV